MTPVGPGACRDPRPDNSILEPGAADAARLSLCTCFGLGAIVGNAREKRASKWSRTEGARKCCRAYVRPLPAQACLSLSLVPKSRMASVSSLPSAAGTWIPALASMISCMEARLAGPTARIGLLAAMYWGSFVDMDSRAYSAKSS